MFCLSATVPADTIDVKCCKLPRCTRIRAVTGVSGLFTNRLEEVFSETAKVLMAMKRLRTPTALLVIPVVDMRIGGASSAQLKLFLVRADNSNWVGDITG
jgi:hypothetical protein